MKPNTCVWLAARNVGDANDSTVCFSGPFVEVIMQLAEWLGPRSMAKRFDMCMGRSEEEARAALRLRKDTGKQLIPNESTEGLVAMIADMMNQNEKDLSDETGA